MTIIEKILANHSDKECVSPGDVIDIEIDARVARDFGGANVVKNLQQNGLDIADPSRTFFTFDCNPGGSDQKYAANQQTCRVFARENAIRIFDINSGIGTHIAIDNGLVLPGGTLVSTDSHANILGAIGAFGQGMGDRDIAHAFAFGKVWFKVPPTVKLVLVGTPSENTSAKDIVLAILRKTGAGGLLGRAVEFDGPIVAELTLDSRITISSMATEMGAIISFVPPNEEIVEICGKAGGRDSRPVFADKDAAYIETMNINIDGLEPLISRPGHPEDVIEVKHVAGKKIDSVFIGSCTNGRIEDMKAAAEILKNRAVAPGVVLKIVPSTDEIWKQCLNEGIIETFKRAGALVGNAGCAGCAAGQIGQNGPGEITVSTGNRNFPGKQGKGEVFLASPAVAAASAVAGVIALPDEMPEKPVLFSPVDHLKKERRKTQQRKRTAKKRPVIIRGRVWVIQKDNIDTDMIYHNRYLTITDISEMGQYTFDNLENWKDFAGKASRGDIVITGKNFGCGSSRQQAVDCFKSLGISLIIAESFGAIYERNAINAGFPILSTDLIASSAKTGQEIEVDLATGLIRNLTTGEELESQGFSDVQMEIYKKGGLLGATE